MSDLISRSELIKHFEAIQQQENVVGLEFIAMIDEIKEQPTAYDIDKVVEELELHSFELGTDTLPVSYVRLNDAIEIVKQGGVSEEVCECRKLKDYNILFETSCGCILAIQEFKYCPYCGKKIKVKQNDN